MTLLLNFMLCAFVSYFLIRFYFDSFIITFNENLENLKLFQIYSLTAFWNMDFDHKMNCNTYTFHSHWIINFRDVMKFMDICQIQKKLQVNFVCTVFDIRLKWMLKYNWQMLSTRVALCLFLVELLKVKFLQQILLLIWA